MEETKGVESKCFNDLADNYMSLKKDTMLNIIKCGKLLSDAKELLSHGQWLIWLQDHRVSESVRTSQRLMSIYQDYGHLLAVGEDKQKPIAQLGLSFLLELKKLPDRFKKEIEVIREVEGKEVKEIRSVIDEEKLADFLDQSVETKDGVKIVRDLPLTELKKVIREATGVYDPGDDDQEEEESIGEEGEKKVSPEEDKKIDTVETVIGGLSHLSISTFDMMKEVEKVDKAMLETIPAEEVDSLKDVVKQYSSAATAMLLKIEGLKGNLGK